MGLGERMKNYEENHDHMVPTDVCSIIRLDGHNFSKFTKAFRKPFDCRLHDCMVSTAQDLLGYFPGATTAYTQSDEISLIFPQGVVDWSGRIQKLISLSAAYASVRFNHWLAHHEINNIGIAHFDSRIFVLPSIEEILNNIIWRCHYDCQRNSKSAFARSFFSARQLHRMKSYDQITKVQRETGMIYDSEVPGWAKFGTIVKRELINVVGLNPIKDTSETTTRTNYKAKDINIDKFSKENLDLLASKYWPSMYKDKSDEDLFQFDI